MSTKHNRIKSVQSQLPRLRGSSDSEQDQGPENGFGTVVVAKPRVETKTPKMYRVIIINDDYTPMDFVILVLQKFFQKELSEATQIMLSVHNKGSGVCGTFTYEIAETKVHHVNQFARQNHHPLKCTMEQA